MYYLTIFEIVGVVLYSAYLIQSICAPEVNIWVKAMALFSWTINFIMLILVPLDIYITFRDHTNGIQSDAYYQIAYFLYWCNFLLCWTIIPIMQEYEDAVDLERRDKLTRSFRNNIKFYVAIGIVGIIFIICIIMTGTAEQYGLGTFLKSMANSFGIALTIILLGYSLVTVPRVHMRTAQLDLQMKYLYFRTAAVHTERQDARHELEEVAKQIIAIKGYIYEDPRFITYVKKCLDKIPDKMRQQLLKPDDKKRKQSYIQGTGKVDQPTELNQMIDLYQSVRRAVYEYKRVKAAWKENCKRAFEMEDITKSLTSEEKRVEFFNKKRRSGKFAKELDTMEWHWLTNYKPQFKIIFSLLLGIMSILVTISEVTLFMNSGFTIFGLPLKISTGLVTIQILAFTPLFYIAFCVYYGLFRIKIAGYYGLYGNHQTDAPSLMFATINFSRVGAPLCQNYISMLKLRQETAFKYAMGNIELIPIFGISITALLPCLLVVLCLVNYFDLYDRFMKFIGMKQFMFTATFSDRLIYEGRDALKARKLKVLKQPQEQQELQIVDGTGGNLEKLL